MYDIRGSRSRFCRERTVAKDCQESRVNQLCLKQLLPTKPDYVYDHIIVILSKLCFITITFFEAKVRMGL